MKSRSCWSCFFPPQQPRERNSSFARGANRSGQDLPVIDPLNTEGRNGATGIHSKPDAIDPSWLFSVTDIREAVKSNWWQPTTAAVPLLEDHVRANNDQPASNGRAQQFGPPSAAPFAAVTAGGNGGAPPSDFTISAAVLTISPPPATAYGGPADVALRPRTSGRATPMQYDAAASEEEEEGSVAALAASGLVLSFDGQHVEALPIEKLVWPAASGPRRVPPPRAPKSARAAIGWRRYSLATRSTRPRRSPQPWDLPM